MNKITEELEMLGTRLYSIKSSFTKCCNCGCNYPSNSIKDALTKKQFLHKNFRKFKQNKLESQIKIIQGGEKQKRTIQSSTSSHLISNKTSQTYRPHGTFRMCKMLHQPPNENQNLERQRPVPAQARIDTISSRSQYRPDDRK